MRRLLLLLAFAFTLFTAAAQPSYPKPTGYVDDFASVLSPEASQALELAAAELHDKTRAQVFVVTVASLSGNDIKPFANDLFHTWKIGEKGTDRGALILFSIADHRWRIEVGSGLEGILNDAKVGDIGRSVVPQLKAADYDAAAEQAFSGVAGVIATDAGVSLTPLAGTTESQPADSQFLTEPDAAPEPSSSSGMTGTYILYFFGLSLFLVFLFIIALLRGRSGSGGSSGSAGPFIGTSSGSSFSSSDSSSSSSSSSSDSSSFSGGDGGDSSGGGADGSW